MLGAFISVATLIQISFVLLLVSLCLVGCSHSLFLFCIQAVSSAETIFCFEQHSMSTESLSIADFFWIWKNINNKREIVSVQFAQYHQTEKCKEPISHYEFTQFSLYSVFGSLLGRNASQFKLFNVPGVWFILWNISC